MNSDLATRSPGQDDLNRVEVRVHSPLATTTLVYLPGVHGDWTLLGGFRHAIGGSVRLVEVTYPRTTRWSLDDYAAGVEQSLGQIGINEAWLLGESFGSQVVWEVLHRRSIQVTGVILAGGFARYPAPWIAGLAARSLARSSFKRLTWAFRAYVSVSKIRFRRSPATLGSLEEFLSRRTPEDCRAVQHRMELVARNDPRQKARVKNAPLYLLTGFWDPIVPWYPAKRWLRKHSPNYCGNRMIWTADHNVLGTAPKAAAAQVREWIAAATAKPPAHDRDTHHG